MRIKYQGVQYKVSFYDKIYISFQKVILFLKRQKRRIQTIISKNILFLYLIITMLWLLFAIVTYYVGQVTVATTENDYTIQDVLWELKNSYFTSVIISFVISVLNNTRVYKTQIKVQYYLYIDTMNDFERFFGHLFDIEHKQYHPLYCEKTINDVTDYILHHSIDRQYAEELVLSIDSILKRLEKLEYEINLGNIEIPSKRDLIECINCVKSEINNLVVNNNLYNNRTVACIAMQLYDILDYIKEPWFRDIKTKINILNRLAKSNLDIVKRNINYEMLLYGLSLEKN